MSVVIDNSVALAWCFEDEQTSGIMALLDRVATDGAVAPGLFPIEALNGLLSAERRGRIDSGVRRRLAGFLRDLPIAIDDETAGRLWNETAVLAQAHGLSAYDATYLELAVRIGLPLATSDLALIAAAGAEGVPVLPTR
jgi:predicted nucleic acid-binding protein